MPRREETSFPQPDDQARTYTGKHFLDESADGESYNGFVFEFCTLEKMGLRETTFERCTFRHCEFIECYMVRANFEQCNLTGSFFKRCNFSWAEFPNSQLDYTRFSECGPVLSQVADQTPRDPQSATKFFRNLAAEHKKLGNWQEVDRLIRQSYKEGERHYYYAFTGANDWYKKRYGGSSRFRYAFRWGISKLNGAVWGYGVSWFSFARSFLLMWLLIFPLVNSQFGELRQPEAFFWTSSPVDDTLRYIAMLYRTTTHLFLPFVPPYGEFVAELSIPFWLVATQSIIGTIFLALFVSLVFRAASKGV